MTISKRVALFLAAFSLASVATLSAAVAALPPAGAATDNGAFVVLGGPPVNGEIAFSYGWNNTNQFAAAPVGYWLGIYDVTNSHYVWASENLLPLSPEGGPGTLNWRSLKIQYSDLANLAPGDYSINFFVRSSYSDPVTNVAVVELHFSIF